jgi:hypothetical protein
MRASTVLCVLCAAATLASAAPAKLVRVTDASAAQVFDSGSPYLVLCANEVGAATTAEFLGKVLSKAHSLDRDVQVASMDCAARETFFAGKSVFERYPSTAPVPEKKGKKKTKKVRHGRVDDGYGCGCRRWLQKDGVAREGSGRTGGLQGQPPPPVLGP